jgi:teichuronic acid biosynthesis glycosyltransferase TuaC
MSVGAAIDVDEVSDPAASTRTQLPVVVLTTFFPNPREPQRTVFVRNLVGAMQEHCDIAIVAPIPKRPSIGAWRDKTPVPTQELHEGFTLLHPRFLAIPGMQWLNGCSYAVAAWPVLRALKRSVGPFVLHAHCAYPDAVGAAILARLLGVPLVVTAHGSDVNVVARNPLLRPQIRWALRSARSVIAVSRALADRVAALIGGSRERIACVPCAGFSPRMFRPCPRAPLRVALQWPGEAWTVVFVGQLVRVKGIDVLLRAWAGLSGRSGPAERRLVLIGEGPERARLEALADELGVRAQVSFLGVLPQQAVADRVAAADVLCLPSHSEGSPNVVVEALASGVPVVATRVGGVPELVRDGVNGLLVPPADAAQLAAALNHASTRAWNAAEIAASVSHLTWPALAQRNLAVLEATMKEARHASAA